MDGKAGDVEADANEDGRGRVPVKLAVGAMEAAPGITIRLIDLYGLRMGL